MLQSFEHELGGEELRFLRSEAAESTQKPKASTGVPGLNATKSLGASNSQQEEKSVGEADTAVKSASAKVHDNQDGQPQHERFP
jgi:hypothetical protein